MKSKALIENVVEILNEEPAHRKSDDDSHWSNRKPITFWVHPEHKKIFEELQRRSRKKFGRLLASELTAVLEEVEKTVDQRTA